MNSNINSYIYIYSSTYIYIYRVYVRSLDVVFVDCLSVNGRGIYSYPLV